jgi:uncharacterized membrane protein YccC
MTTFDWHYAGILFTFPAVAFSAYSYREAWAQGISLALMCVSVFLLLNPPPETEYAHQYLASWTAGCVVGACISVLLYSARRSRQKQSLG